MNHTLDKYCSFQLFIQTPFCKGSLQKDSLKGMAQYGWPPCTNQLWSVAFYIENIFILLLNKLP